MPLPIEQTGGRSPHAYIPNTRDDQDAMLERIGVPDVEALFGDMPQDKLVQALNLPIPLSEQSIRRVMSRLSQQNMYWDGRVTNDNLSFQGNGVYAHFIPSPILNLLYRGEFSTSYTPYAPEISQGTLGYTFDWQTMICRLTGMDVANTGMYDGATALAEAALMTARVAEATGNSGRRVILALDTIRPEVLDVVRTYCWGQDLEVKMVSADGELPLDGKVASVLIGYPNRFGVIEDVKSRAEEVHRAGAKLVTYTDNPMALGMFKSPGSLGADIATGEAQSFGNRPSFGGPFIGFFAVKADPIARANPMVGEMPGRIVGQTTDSLGRVGKVLTLQTREQHIRREDATSNICTAEALVALASTIYLSLVGNRGLREIAGINYHNARYAAEQLASLPGYKLPMEGQVAFNEFLLECPIPYQYIEKELLQQGIIGGVRLHDVSDRQVLICTTDLHTKEDIDRLSKAFLEAA